MRFLSKCRELLMISGVCGVALSLPLVAVDYQQARLERAVEASRDNKLRMMNHVVDEGYRLYDLSDQLDV
ncbi:hypothetical protein O9X98_04335 [Agrobacterium salinitolerans]|nr:hypothetical protein [Agrobacterium salinitolerans]